MEKRKISLAELFKRELDKETQNQIRGGDCPWANCQCNEPTVPDYTAYASIQVLLHMNEQ